MEPETNLAGIEDELKRRHRSAVLVVGGFFLLTLVLILIAFVSGDALFRPGDPSLAMALWIAILIFGLGAVTLRRTRFSAMRLQDIAALQGFSGLLATLERTTIQVAALGGAIALMGFVVTILTARRDFMTYAGLLAIAVLVYGYPRRTGWERVVEGIELTGDANDPPAQGRNV